jgi:hypothetical protein
MALKEKSILDLPSASASLPNDYTIISQGGKHKKIKTNVSAPVRSVSGKTGDIILVVADVSGALGPSHLGTGATSTNPHPQYALTSENSPVRSVRGSAEPSGTGIGRVGHVVISPANIGLGNVTDEAQIPLSTKGISGGVASLDASGKVPDSQISDSVKTRLFFTSGGSAEIITLPAQVNDLVYDNDVLEGLFLLMFEPASTFENWYKIKSDFVWLAGPDFTGQGSYGQVLKGTANDPYAYPQWGQITNDDIEPGCGMDLYKLAQINAFRVLGSDGAIGTPIQLQCSGTGFVVRQDSPSINGLFINAGSGQNVKLTSSIFSGSISASSISGGSISGATFSNPLGLTKTNVGLANVDNTSDIAKPLSNAVTAALLSKAATSYPTLDHPTLSWPTIDHGIAAYFEVRSLYSGAASAISNYIYSSVSGDEVTPFLAVDDKGVFSNRIKSIAISANNITSITVTSGSLISTSVSANNIKSITVTADSLTTVAALIGVSGASGNYATFDASGSLKNFGGARKWNDINLSISSLRGGPTAPTATQIGTTGLYALHFANTTTSDEVHGSTEILHDYAEGTDIYPHIHWSPSTSAAGNVQWELLYAWVPNNTSITGAMASASVVTAASGIPYAPQYTSFGAINGTGKVMGSRFVFRLRRYIGAGTADTYAATVAGFDFGIHYQKDTFGSTSQSLK